MKIKPELIEGLEMIENRYYFGYFSSAEDSSMDFVTESEEYRMRDAFFEIIRLLKEEYRTEKNLSDLVAQ